MIDTTESELLVARNEMPIEVLDTSTVFSGGILCSSGTAEVNSQSSSAAAPLEGWTALDGRDCAGGFFVFAKSNMEPVGC